MGTSVGGEIKGLFWNDFFLETFYFTYLFALSRADLYAQYGRISTSKKRDYFQKRVCTTDAKGRLDEQWCQLGAKFPAASNRQHKHRMILWTQSTNEYLEVKEEKGERIIFL